LEFFHFGFLLLGKIADWLFSFASPFGINVGSSALSVVDVCARQWLIGQFL